MLCPYAGSILLQYIIMGANLMFAQRARAGAYGGAEAAQGHVAVMTMWISASPHTVASQLAQNTLRTLPTGTHTCLADEYRCQSVLIRGSVGDNST